MLTSLINKVSIQPILKLIVGRLNAYELETSDSYLC